MNIRELNYCLDYLASEIRRKIRSPILTLKIIKPSPRLYFLFHLFFSIMNHDCFYVLWLSYRGREGRMMLFLAIQYPSSWIPPETCDVGSGCGFQPPCCLKEHLDFLTKKRVNPLPHFLYWIWCIWMNQEQTNKSGSSEGLCGISPLTSEIPEG